MRPPFLGMDPWLEHPALWPDVHNRLIAAIADELTPRLAPKYYVGLEQRAYSIQPGELVLVGLPDIAVSRPGPADLAIGPAEAAEAAGVGVLDVEVPVSDQLEEWFLEIHDVETGTLITVLEILSPVNKVHSKGREAYITKRDLVFASETSLVEIDLLRAGEPMPLNRRAPRADYRVLVSRSATRPRAKLFVFNLRQPIPAVPIPLLPGDVEPELDLGAVLHALYDRARFDLRLDYAKPPVPPLSEPDAEWARTITNAPREG